MSENAEASYQRELTRANLLQEQLDEARKKINDLTAQLTTAQADKDALYKANVRLVQSYDGIVGTPCEQVRHAQEVEALREQLAETETKVEALCHQNGALMIENHDLKRQLAQAQARIEELERGNITLTKGWPDFRSIQQKNDTLKAQLATVTQQYTAAIQHIEELVTTPRSAQLLSKLIQAERDIESLQQCQCDGCEERLEDEAYCLGCMAKLREQLQAQSVTYQDNLTEIQLLKAQIVNREKEVDRLMAQRNLAEAKLLVLEQREVGYLSELDDYARTVLALRARVKACEAEHGLHRVQP